MCQDGSMNKVKLVARGYEQILSVDYDANSYQKHGPFIETVI